MEVGDVSGTGAVGLLLLPASGLVVETIASHRLLPAGLDWAVHPDVERVWPALQNKDRGSAEDDGAFRIGNAAERILSGGNVAVGASMVEGCGDANEEPAVGDRSAEKSPHGAALIGLVVSKCVHERVIELLGKANRDRSIDQRQPKLFRDRRGNHAASRPKGCRNRDRSQIGLRPLSMVDEV
jgi:hypothetical protein